MKSAISRFRSCCLGTGSESVIGDEKNYIVYSLFCIFIIFIITIIIIIIIIISISISFVVLLNCLYLNPRVSPFVHFSSPEKGEA